MYVYFALHCSILTWKGHARKKRMTREILNNYSSTFIQAKTVYNEKISFAFFIPSREKEKENPYLPIIITQDICLHLARSFDALSLARSVAPAAASAIEREIAEAAKASSHKR